MLLPECDKQELYWEEAVAESVGELMLFGYATSNNSAHTAWFLQDLKDRTKNQYIKNFDIKIVSNPIINLTNIINYCINNKLYLIQSGEKDIDNFHALIFKLFASCAISLNKQYRDIDKNLITQNDLISILIKKQKDYGPKNISKFGITGLFIRMHDKIARIENLTIKNTEVSVENESLVDTILDIMGYSAIALMWIDGTFLCPMKE